MKKILFSLMSLTLVVGLVGAGAFAYFSDTSSANGSALGAGTLDLKIDDADEQEADGVCQTWTMDNMAPGDTMTAYISLRNAGTIDADKLSIKFDYDTDCCGRPAGLFPVGDDDIADKLRIVDAGWGLYFPVTDPTNPAGYHPLKNAGNGALLDGTCLSALPGAFVQMYDGWPSPGPMPCQLKVGAPARYVRITWQLDADADNYVQGCVATVTVSVLADQQ